MDEQRRQAASEFRQDYGQSRRFEEPSIEHKRSSKSCTAKATNGFVNGTVLGGTMSGLTAMARATQLQIRFPAAVRAVVGATIAGGVSFGLALGVYQGVVCSLQQSRGVDDIKNSMIAGGFVGAMSEIPVFIRSRVVTKADILLAEQGMSVMRPRPRFLINAAGGSIICGLFYMVDSGMRSSPKPKPQGIPQSPQASTPSRPEEQELDPWIFSDSQESSSEWVFTDPPSEEVIENENMGWDSK